MLRDARSIADGSRLVCDVCVIGGGPAGIALVNRLRGSGLSVCLVEGGGTEPQVRQQNLYRGESVGHPYFPLHSCRFRMFGGSSNRWGGWCRPLEPDDFEPRDWVPHSGWPIRSADVEPYYEAAARLFGLPPAAFDIDVGDGRLPAPLPLDGPDFANGLFQYCEETNFGTEYLDELKTAAGVTVLLHASATDLKLAAGTNRVGTVPVATLAGNRLQVDGRVVVLATGGIENARLLLAARADRPAGLGNERDQVGRCFMEHLHVPSGHLILSPDYVDDGFYRKSRYGSLCMRGVLIPTADAQRRYRLLGTSIAIEQARYHYGTPFLDWPPQLTLGPVRAHRALRRLGAPRVGELAKGVAEQLYNAGRVRRTARTSAKARERDGANDLTSVRSLYFRSEQAPDPASRVTLAAERDALGLPRPRLDWRVGRQDTESIERWLEYLQAAVSARGIGRIVPPTADWQSHVIGGPHHMGTTRMSSRPQHGVVDADARVHSVDNLYVAGSSVFTTGGFANPTFTLVALALRLADHVARVYR